MILRMRKELPSLTRRKSQPEIPGRQRPGCGPSKSLRLRCLLAGLLIGLASLQLFCFAGVAECYDLAGHFDTVAAAIYGLNPGASPDEANLVTFCGWLPDRSQELSAFDVYTAMPTGSPLAYLCWSASYGPLKTYCSSAPVANMVAVQQLLHGLTGGDSRAVQAVAREAVRQLHDKANSSPDLNAQCALGFALHLYGDSFAHTELTWRQSAHPEQGRMYPTGIGHGPDFHKPDRPFYRPDRVQLWKTYVTSLAAFFVPAKEGDPIHACIDNAWADYSKNGNYYRDMYVTFDYGETYLEKYLIKCIPDPKHVLKPFPYTDVRDQPCEKLIKMFPVSSPDHLTCAKTWQIFRDASARAYRACAQHTLQGCEHASARDERYSKYDNADPLGESSGAAGPSSAASAKPPP